MTNETHVVKEKVPKKRIMSTHYIILVALFSGLAFVVMYFEFPIAALFPSLKFDLSEVVVFIGGVILGPLAVVLIELIKNILNLIIKSSTGGIGELANFTAGVALILPTIYIIKNSKTILRAIVGFVVGIVSVVLITSICNYFVFMPVFGTPAEMKMDLILYTFVPFNAVKGLIVAIISITLHISLKGVYRFMKVQ